MEGYRTQRLSNDLFSFVAAFNSEVYSFFKQLCPMPRVLLFAKAAENNMCRGEYEGEYDFESKEQAEK